ncbi:MAG: type II toxin-antitoxin system HicB family antitoxin [Bacteroidia bacterium]
MKYSITASYVQVSEGYIAFINEIPGVNTQGETLEEAKANLREALQLVLAANRELALKEFEGKNVTTEEFESL